MIKRNYDSNDITFLKEVEKNHFWYILRNLLVEKLLSKHVPSNIAGEIIRIVDIGAGNGSSSLIIKRFGKYIAYESNFDATKNCKLLHNITVCGDAEKIALKEKSIEIALMLDCLEHLKDDKEVLKEIKRILKPRGKVIIFVPAFERLWTSFDTFSFHFRRYDKDSLGKLLVSAGFQIKESSYFFSVLFPILYYFALYEKHVKKATYRHSWRKKLAPPFFLVNKLLFVFGKIELIFFKHLKVPFGTTCIYVAENN